jgi:hypothetical protein
MTASVVSGIALALKLFEVEEGLAPRQEFRSAAMAMGLGVAMRDEAVGVVTCSPCINAGASRFYDATIVTPPRRLCPSLSMFLAAL